MLQEQPREFFLLDEGYELRFVGEEKGEIRRKYAMLWKDYESSNCVTIER
jgi:hypothetical protein